MQRTMSKPKRILLTISRILGIIIVLLAAGLGIWLLMTKSAVSISAPVRTMPNPNAYDYYIKAAARITMKEDVQNATSTPRQLQGSPQGLQSMDPNALAKLKSIPPVDLSGRPQSPRNYTLLEKVTIVKANEPAFKLLRQGLEYQCMTPKFDMISSFSQNAELRELARLISLESQVYAESGKYGKAMQSCLDGIQLGADTTQGSNLVGYLVSAAISAISIQNTESGLVGKLSSQEAKESAARLEKIVSGYAPFVEILTNEKFTGIESLRSLKYPSASPDIDQQFGDQSTGNKGVSDKFFIRMVLPRYIADWDRAISQAKKPYMQYASAPALNTGVLMQMTEPVIAKARFKYEYTLCQQHLLLLQLALRAYETANGKYPAELKDLTPKYLKQIPADRFAVDQTYIYKQTPTGYILYSVGPDGRDDGGKVVFESRKPKMENPGDIVISK